MKKLVFLALLFYSAIGISQPIGFYDNVDGLVGQDLKNELHELIKGHVQYTYTSSSTDVWDILKETDKDPNNSNNVILIYSGASVDGPQEYNSGNGWTREHVWAKSKGDFGTDPGPGTDVHALRPCNNSINSTRNNRCFDNCQSCTDVLFDGNITGSKRDNDIWSFEPRDEVKGDVARMVFYMATRYEVEDGIDLELIDYVMDKSSKDPTHGVVTTLLEWNKLDTVDAFEKNRNELIYTYYQKNRNPYIDHPEFADYIFGDKQTELFEYTSIKELSKSSFNYTWQGNILTLSESIDFEFTIKDAAGRLIRSMPSNNTKVSFLNEPKGLYILQNITSGESFKIVY